MADVIDQANDYAEVMLSNKIASRVVFAGVSATHSADCDCLIPRARREAVKGCQLCVDCQQIAEVRRG